MTEDQTTVQHWNVEEWEPGNNEAAYFNQRARWVPMGNTHHHREHALDGFRFWRQHRPERTHRVVETTVTTHIIEQEDAA